MLQIADESPSLTRRLLEIFTSPRRLAAGFATRPVWLDVLVLTTLVAIAAAAALPDEYFVAQAEGAVNRRGEPVTVTSPPEDIARYGRYLAMFSALIGHPLMIFAVAGLLMLGFSILGRGRGSFRSYLALTAHAFVISAVGTLMAIGWQQVTGAPEAHLSLARLLGAPTRDGGWGVLDNLNPFTLWMLTVLALGIVELDHRRSFPQTAMVLLGSYLALAVGLASVG